MKNTEFLEMNAKFLRKSCENHQKRLIFKNTRLILKRDLSASPINGFEKNINIDLKTTRRHLHTIHRFS